MVKRRKKKELMGALVIPGKAKRKARIINNIEDLEKVKEGEIAVVFPPPTPELITPLLHLNPAAILTEGGFGTVSHTAIILREIPKCPCLCAIYPTIRIIKDGDSK